MAKVLLGVTGSVAAIRTPALFAALVAAGHEVRVVATAAARYFFAADALPTGSLIVDADEWPGQATGQLYQREDTVLHIELRRWADLLLIAPLDANTLAKLAYGLSDNCLTCVCRAWDRQRPLLLAPAMNTLMWDHPQTARHFRLLLEDFALGPVQPATQLEALVAQINATCPRLQIVGPQVKQLACGDVGQGAMAEVVELVAAVKAKLLAG